MNTKQVLFIKSKRSWPSNLRPFLGALIIGGLLVGCNKSDDKKEGDNKVETHVIDTASLKDSAGLANAGEQLMGPYSFMYADSIFKESLKKDPQNKKAQFYRAALEAPMSLQGILTRIRPLAKSRKQLADIEKFIAEFPESPTKAFLVEITDPEVQTDITKDNFQDFIVTYREKLNNWRKFLKQNHDLELTLSLNPEVYDTRISDNINNSCIPIRQGETVYTIKCDFTKILQVKVEQADIIALQQTIAGMLLYYSIPTSYDWNALVSLYNGHQRNPLSGPQLIEFIHAGSAFAPLRKDHSLKELEELGSDFAGALRWVMDRRTQVSLCPNGKSGRVRSGHLFVNGMCISENQISEIDQILLMIESVFQGPTPIDIATSNGMYKATLDFSKFKQNPPKDLRLFVPTQLNSCGRPAQFIDSTFSGLLPNQDWHNLIETDCNGVNL